MVKTGRFPLFKHLTGEFKIEGAQKMSSAHYERKTRNSFNSGGVNRARLRAL